MISEKELKEEITSLENIDASVKEYITQYMSLHPHNFPDDFKRANTFFKAIDTHIVLFNELQLLKQKYDMRDFYKE